MDDQKYIVLYLSKNDTEFYTVDTEHEANGLFEMLSKKAKESQYDIVEMHEANLLKEYPGYE